MSMTATDKPFTGRHMLAILITFFGVVFAVNFLMAYLANSTWSGLVVENGYVASQSFDKDLQKSKAQEALGWTIGFSDAGGRITLTFDDAQKQAIDGLTITGALQRPTTDKLDQKLTFSANGAGVYAAPAQLTPGLWEVEIDAKGNAATPDYHKIFRFVVKG